MSVSTTSYAGGRLFKSPAGLGSEFRRSATEAGANAELENTSLLNGIYTTRPEARLNVGQVHGKRKGCSYKLWYVMNRHCFSCITQHPGRCSSVDFLLQWAIDRQIQGLQAVGAMGGRGVLFGIVQPIN